MRFEEYESSHITPQYTLLKKFNKILEYLKYYESVQFEEVELGTPITATKTLISSGLYRATFTLPEIYRDYFKLKVDTNYDGNGLDIVKFGSNNFMYFTTSGSGANITKLKIWR